MTYEEQEARFLELNKHTFAREDAARAMLAALTRMVADLREQEATGLGKRMRLSQIMDLDHAIKAAKAAGIVAEG